MTPPIRGAVAAMITLCFEETNDVAAVRHEGQAQLGETILPCPRRRTLIRLFVPNYTGETGPAERKRGTRAPLSQLRSRGTDRIS